MSLRTTVAVGSLVCLLGCSTSSTSTGASDSGPAASDAGTADADNAPRLMDGSACPASLDAFKPCATPADCTVAAVSGCCGVPSYVGIAKTASADYASCYPREDCSALGCAGSSDCKAEDGNTGHCQFDQSALGAACTAGRCTSFIKTDAGVDGG